MRSDDFEKYMGRGFIVDCPRMVLRQNTESPDRVYEGPGSIYQTAEGGLMFKLEYVITHPQAEWHPVSERVHLAVAGDASPLDAGLLALSVAVEGVLKTGFSKLAVPDDCLREHIEAARKLVTDSGLSDSFKPRLFGALGAMLAPRAKDKLLALQKAGVIRKELVDAWRRPGIHRFFNELVFLVIGYAGQYTDYSVVGWPLRNFEKTMKDLEGSVDHVSAPVDRATQKWKCLKQTICTSQFKTVLLLCGLSGYHQWGTFFLVAGQEKFDPLAVAGGRFLSDIADRQQRPGLDEPCVNPLASVRDHKGRRAWKLNGLRGHPGQLGRASRFGFLPPK